MGDRPPRLGPFFSQRDLKTHICKPPFACQNVLKLTYSNLEFQNFWGRTPGRESASKCCVCCIDATDGGARYRLLFKGRGREGKGKGRRRGRIGKGGKEWGGAEGRGARHRLHPPPLETNYGSAPVLAHNILMILACKSIYNFASSLLLA